LKQQTLDYQGPFPTRLLVPPAQQPKKLGVKIAALAPKALSGIFSWSMAEFLGNGAVGGEGQAKFIAGGNGHNIA
jgi:hypothetical protein